MPDIKVKITSEFYSDAGVAQAAVALKRAGIPLSDFSQMWSKIGRMVMKNGTIGGQPNKPKLVNAYTTITLDEDVFNSPVCKIMEDVGMLARTETYRVDALSDEKFEEFWSAFPARNGHKVGKLTAKKSFKLNILGEPMFQQLMEATRNYARVANIPRDAERFLRDEYWKGYLSSVPESANSNETIVTAAQLRAMLRE